MADVNKTIDIQIKADMKEMLSQLKKMPNMAGDEAKKMVNELKRQFQRAEIAAKAQAKAHAKANKEMADSTKTATNSMVRDMDKQIAKSKSARTQSREMGSALGGLGDIVGELSPELGGLAVTIGTVGTAFKSLARSMATGNPYVLAIVAAVAAAAAAYSLFTASAKENEAGQKRLSDAIAKTNEEIEISRQAFSNAETAMQNNAGQVNDLRLQYQLLKGDISEAEVAEMKREQAASEFGEKAQADFEQQRKALFQTKTLINTQIQEAEIRKQQLKDLNRLYVLQGGTYKLTKEGADLEAQIAKLQKERGDISAEQAKLKVEGQERVNSVSDEYYQLLKDIAIETKRQEHAEKALARSQQIRAENNKKATAAGKLIGITLTKHLKDEEDQLNKIQKVGSDAQQDAMRLAQMNEQARIGLLDNSVQKINEQIELEKKLLDSKIASLEAIKAETMAQAQNATQIFAAKQAQIEIDKQIAAERESSSIREEQLTKQRVTALQAETKERMNMTAAIVTNSIDAANSISTIIRNVGGENKKAAMVAFRIQQAASLANIAMLTAQKIMEVAPNPFAIAGVSALGALQAGVVLSQSPPEKHMGGVITKGEDTQNVTVLSGEAVLNRMTVERLGGEQGINRLQRGIMPQGQVVVMNPFKHFDRYAQSSLRRGGSLATIANKKASGGY